MDLQCSLALLNAPQMQDRVGSTQSHTALKGLENVTSFAKQETLDKQRLAGLAQQYGLGKVIRWKPRKVRSKQMKWRALIEHWADTFARRTTCRVPAKKPCLPMHFTRLLVH